ncbi:hypothetical protein RHGRI_038856 [Rhododendron griersonianum]|uniref:At1g61320/AtMIF1 LRR domain-containing protein n=1 Tax=Rhododendron griersonianum TaxID=479676 RepID=A0AAV6HND8_9ERIC|nr:hypothetical protein RHGRI_038856 [Rhododendron griersonianum]
MSIGDAKKVALSEQIDRISSLPDQLLAHILSFLPTKDAVKTVLIRRFGNLWTAIHNLDFDVCLYQECREFSYEFGPENEERLIDLIRHVLILHESSDIHRFRLKFEFNVWSTSEQLKLATEIDTWIHFALRKKVKVLELDFKACGNFGHKGYHKFPNVVLTGDTLTELNLVYCRVEPQEHIQLRSLKSLSLNCVLISEETMTEIISGSPALENLFIYGCVGFHKLNFTSVNLKNVVIELFRYDSSRLEVSCPFVTSLNISDIERMHLNNLSSVVDAAVSFNGYLNCDHGEYFHKVKMLFQQFCGAEAFTLFTRSILVFTIWELIKSSFPSMNWRRLVLKTMLTKWHLPGIASLLRNSPHLEMLDIHMRPGTKPFCYRDDWWLKEYEIDGENFWDFQLSSFDCLRSHLKTIRIHSFKIEPCAVKLVHFLLRKAYVLEKLVIDTNRESYPDKENQFMSERWTEFSREYKQWRESSIESEQWTEFSRELLCFPRASPQAVILFL